jgi:hypothetical protein
MRCCSSSSAARVAPTSVRARSRDSGGALPLSDGGPPAACRKWIIDEFGQRIACDSGVDLARVFDDYSRVSASDHESAAEWRALLPGVGAATASTLGAFRLAKPERFAAMCLRGIPASMRGSVWMHATGAAALMRQHASPLDPRSYACVRQRAAATPSPSLRQIAVDVPRTHGAHPYFAPAPAHDSARPALLRVLHCVALSEPEIGYMQGMNMIAALFLLVCGEEEPVYWLMLAFLRHYRMLDMYRDGLVRLQTSMATFGALFHTHLPALSTHMNASGVLPMCYATPWFVTAFAYNCDVPSAARMFDVFFLLIPGEEFVHRLGLAYLALNQRRMMRHEFSDLVVETKEMEFDDDDEYERRRASADMHSGRNGAADADWDDESSASALAVLRAAHALDLADLLRRANVTVGSIPFPDQGEPAEAPPFGLAAEASSIAVALSVSSAAAASRPHTPVLADRQPFAANHPFAIQPSAAGDGDANGSESARRLARPSSSVRVVHQRPSSATIRLRVMATNSHAPEP